MTQEGGTPPDFWGRIQKMIDDAVARLARSGMLRNASITDGGLTIKGGFLQLLTKLGTSLFYIGPVTPSLPDGTPQQGWIIRRADGTVVLTLFDAFPGVDGTLNQALGWFDRAGNVALADDTNSGQGVARPFVPGAFYRARNGDWPVVTSTDFETVYRAKLPKQHPRLIVKAWGASNTSGATGEIRVLVNNQPLGLIGTTAFGVVTEYTFGPAPVAGAHMAELSVEIQARVASGTGGVQVGASQVQGMQS